MFHCKPMKEDGNLMELILEYVEIFKFHIEYSGYCKNVVRPQQKIARTI